MVGLKVTSKRTYAIMRHPWPLLSMPLSPRQTIVNPRFTEDLQTLTGRYDPVSCRVTDPFPWVIGHMMFCLCLPNVCFPQSCRSSVIKSHWHSKVRFPEDSQYLFQIPRLGSQMWVLESLQQCNGCFGIIALQFLGHPSGSSMVGLQAVY